jgi:hypothetical protein
MNPIATFFGLNKNKDPKGVTFEEILDEDVIEVINSAGDSYFKEPPVAGPSNLTSPSLESLNNKASNESIIIFNSSAILIPSSRVTSLSILKIVSIKSILFLIPGLTKEVQFSSERFLTILGFPKNGFTLPSLLKASSILDIIFSKLLTVEGGKLSGFTVEVDDEEELEEVGELSLSISQPSLALLFKDSKEGEVRLEGPATGGSLK